MSSEVNLPFPWERKLSITKGCFYYINPETKVSQWKLPKGAVKSLVETKPQKAASAKKVMAILPPQPKSSADSGKTKSLHSAPSVESGKAKKLKRDVEDETKPAKKSKPSNELLPRVLQVADPAKKLPGITPKPVAVMGKPEQNGIPPSGIPNNEYSGFNSKLSFELKKKSSKVGAVGSVAEKLKDELENRREVVEWASVFGRGKTERNEDEEEEMEVEYSQEVQMIFQEILGVREQMKNVETVEMTSEVQMIVDNMTSAPQCDRQKLWFVLDTNLFLEDIQMLKDLKHQLTQQFGDGFVLVIPWIVIQEIDRIKDRYKSISKVLDLGVRARIAVNVIHNWLEMRDPCIVGQNPRDAASKNQVKGGFTVENNDDKILHCCMQFEEKYSSCQVALLTLDKNLRNKAMVMEINTFSKEALYKWLKTVTPNKASNSTNQTHQISSSNSPLVSGNPSCAPQATYTPTKLLTQTPTKSSNSTKKTHQLSSSNSPFVKTPTPTKASNSTNKTHQLSSSNSPVVSGNPWSTYRTSDAPAKPLTHTTTKSSNSTNQTHQLSSSNSPLVSGNPWSTYRISDAPAKPLTHTPVSSKALDRAPISLSVAPNYQLSSYENMKRSPLELPSNPSMVDAPRGHGSFAPRVGVSGEDGWSSRGCPLASPLPHVAAFERNERTNAIVNFLNGQMSSVESVMLEGLSGLVELSMMDAYKAVWEDVLVIQKPWSVTKLLYAIDRHWIALFALFWPRDDQDLVRLLGRAFKNRPDTFSGVSNVLGLCRQLWSTFDPKSWEVASSKDHFEEVKKQSLIRISGLEEALRRGMESQTYRNSAQDSTPPSSRSFIGMDSSAIPPTASSIPLASTSGFLSGPPDPVKLSEEGLQLVLGCFDAVLKTLMTLRDLVKEGLSSSSSSNRPTMLRTFIELGQHVCAIHDHYARALFESKNANESGAYFDLLSTLTSFAQEVNIQVSSVDIQLLQCFFGDVTKRALVEVGLSQFQSIRSTIVDCRLLLTPSEFFLLSNH